MKKKNTRAKGDNAERIALKQLEVDHLVIRSPRKFIMLPGGRFISKENDYFGLWDLIAKKDGNTKWIQVKAGTKDHIYDKRREMEEFKDKYCSDSESVEVWFKADGTTKFEKYIYNDKWVQEI